MAGSEALSQSSSWTYDGLLAAFKTLGVRQGQKIRAVDDFSGFLINASVSTSEKLQLFGIDGPSCALTFCRSMS